jgi:hypothetical protein
MIVTPATTNIPTLVVAIYAAAVSTIIAIVQAKSYRRDRVTIKITAHSNMQIIHDPRYEGMTLTIVTVANAGRRPVTIRSMGAECLHPHPNWAFVDSNPQLPCELTEGRQVVTNIDQAGLRFNEIDFWYAYDSLGRYYRLRVAPWYMHLWSKWMRKRMWKREKARK